MLHSFILTSHPEGISDHVVTVVRGTTLSTLVEITFTFVPTVKQITTKYVPGRATVILVNEMNTWTEATSELVCTSLISATALSLHN